MADLRHLALLFAGGVALAATPTGAIAGPLGSTTLLDRPTDGAALPGDDNAFSIFQSPDSMSADGNRIVFESETDSLAAPDGNPDTRYVYVRDRAAGTTTNVCRASGTKGALADGDCHDAAISRNGRYVVFSSRAHDLAAVATPTDTFELYRRDLVTGATDLISRRSGVAGAVASQGVSERGTVADNGTVVFSTGDALDPALDTANHTDVYARVGNSTVLLSRTSGGTVGNDSAGEPVVSGDGGTVAFVTASSNFSPGDTNGVDDVYSAPISGVATPTLESRKPTSVTAGNGASRAPVLSQTGRYVAFQTSATNLFGGPVTADTNGEQDVILRDRTAGTNTVASVTAGSVLGNGSSTNPTISADGSVVAFSTSAPNLEGASTGDSGVAVIRDPGANTTTATSRVGGPGTAPIGGYVGGISTSAGIVALDLTAVDGSGGNSLIYTEKIGGSIPELVSRPSGSGALPTTGTGDTSIGRKAVSADGRFVVFLSSSAGLASDPIGDAGHVFVRDALLGTTTLVDRAGGPAGPPANGYAGEPTISADGSTIAFSSSATDLAPGSDGDHQHLFVVDRASGAVAVADRNAAGAIAGDVGSDASLSADGSSVAFASWTPLVDADTNGNGDIYVRNLKTGATTLAGRGTGPNGVIAAFGTYSGVLSGDGTKVVFSTDAPNFVPADLNGHGDAFVRDLVTGTTTLASRQDGIGAPATDGDSGAADLSTDGSKVLFTSVAGNLGDGAPGGTLTLHVRDLVTGKTTWADRTADGAAPGGDVSSPSISGDGTRVAYVSGAANQLLPDTNGNMADAYLTDLTTGRTVRTSVGDGVAGAQGARDTENVSLSADGRCVVFSTTSTGLVPGGYASTDFAHVYERAVGGDCPVVPPVAPNGQSSQGSGGGGATAVAKDTLAPKLGKLALTRKAFAVQGRKKGTTLSFVLSEAATVKIAAAPVIGGKRKGTTCVAPKKAPKKAKACKRTGALTAVKTIAAPVGVTKVPFDGKVGRNVLKRGHYRFVLTATDRAGNASTATVDFSVR